MPHPLDFNSTNALHNTGSLRAPDATQRRIQDPVAGFFIFVEVAGRVEFDHGAFGNCEVGHALVLL